MVGDKCLDLPISGPLPVLIHLSNVTKPEKASWRRRHYPQASVRGEPREERRGI